MGLRGRSSITLNDPLVDLSGTTLKVYFILLSSRRPLSIREVQRLAGFKSPNSARHHLERLVSMGYAARGDGGYVAVRPRSSLFSLFVVLRGSIFPRSLFYALSSTIFLLFYILARYPVLDAYSLSFLALFSTVLWIDTISVYRKIRRLVSASIS